MIVQFDPWILLQLQLQLEGAQQGGGSSSSSSALAAGGLAGLKVGLINTSMVLSRLTLFSQIQQPIYPGYAAQDLLWNLPRLQSDGSWATSGNMCVWRMNDNSILTNVFGYFVYRPGADPVAYWAEMFTNPIVLATVADVFQLSVEWAANANSPASATVIQ